MRTLWQRLGAYLALFMIYVSPVKAETWDSILATIRKRFPNARQLPTTELQTWLDDPTREPRPLLVDVRGAEEYAVSHLQGAIRFESVEQIKSTRTSAAQSVVVYCSVGYRSSAMAEKLIKAGVTNVWNLEGSIFAWANEGRDVYRDAKRLHPAQVHPYDAKWGQLLKPEWRAALK